MNSRIGKRIGTGIMAILLIICFIPAISGAFAPGDAMQHSGFHGEGHHRPALGIWRDSQMVEKLGLTPDQVKQIRDADFSFREKCLPLKAQLDGLRLQMDKAFSQDVVDDTIVLKTAQTISDIEGKLFVQKIETVLTLGKILNADQIKKLKLYEMKQKRKDMKQCRKQLSNPFMKKVDDL